MPDFTPILEPEALLAALRWRYATKQFNPEQRIAAPVWETLEEALVLTPSSYGMQPWRFLILTDREQREALVPAAYGQRQVADCSHLVVMAVPREIGMPDVDRWVARMAEARGTTPEALAKFGEIVARDIIHGPRGADRLGWAKLQAYIALGNFMTCAALLGVDTCPMEGFSPSKVDEALGLEPRGLTSAVLCPAGYRAPGDKYAALPKVRFEKSDVIEHIG
ncbi:MAG: NAD(P)H-dependent oxidoreductase [Verrucomicrobiales bacterium]|nr:NAD(P)H-dependent oxidoreductase [Verrucomicrobiales bacterium]